MESVLCGYMANKWNSALRQEFRVQETDKGLLQEECLRLNTRVNKVKGTMKDTMELVDKLQADLNEANTSKFALENWVKSAEDQVTILQH